METDHVHRVENFERLLLFFFIYLFHSTSEIIKLSKGPQHRIIMLFITNSLIGNVPNK